MPPLLAATLGAVPTPDGVAGRKGRQLPRCLPSPPAPAGESAAVAAAQAAVSAAVTAEAEGG